MTLELSHLAGPAREQAFQDANARIRLVQTARWVGFSRAQMAVEELERRYHYPTCARMPCMLLYGDSGMGKTMILEKMERQHPSTLEFRAGFCLVGRGRLDGGRGAGRLRHRRTTSASMR